MARWFQSDLSIGDRCEILEGDAFANKVVARAETPEIAASIVAEHNFDQLETLDHTKHTPTPWKVGHGPNNEVEIWGRMRMNSSPILMSLGFMEHDPREANAAFIVKAANSHDALIAAVNCARTHLITLGGDPRKAIAEHGDGDEIQAAVLDELDGALASIKEFAK